MEIVLIVGLDEHILAGGSTRGFGLHVGPDDTFSHRSQALAQIDPIVGASWRRIAGRANLLSSITFGVSVEFESADDALRYKAFYPVSCPRYGVLELRPDDNNSDFARFASTHIESVDARQLGASVLIRYSINATNLTMIDPNA